MYSITHLGSQNEQVSASDKLNLATWISNAKQIGAVLHVTHAKLILSEEIMSKVSLNVLVKRFRSCSSASLFQFAPSRLAQWESGCR